MRCRAAQEGPACTLPDRDLAPELPTRHPRLRSLDAETMAEMDAFADGTLTAYLRSERTIWDYRWSDRFDSSFDTWATTSDWVRLADGLVGGDWPDPAAVLVLLDVGDPRGRQKALDLLQRIEPHDEVSDAEVELAWRFRHELPGIARKWFGASRSIRCLSRSTESVLATLGESRYVLANEGFDIDDEKTWSERANPANSGLRPNAQLRSRVRLRLMEWARTTWKWSPAESDELKKALWLGLDEVASASTRMPISPTDCCAATAGMSCLTNRASCLALISCSHGHGSSPPCFLADRGHGSQGRRPCRGRPNCGSAERNPACRQTRIEHEDLSNVVGGLAGPHGHRLEAIPVVDPPASGG